MTQAIKNILRSRTVGEYGTNKLGDLMRTLDTHFKEHIFIDIEHDEFVKDNPDVTIKDLLVAATLRGHHVVHYATKSRIWLTKAVSELVMDMTSI